MHLDKQFVIDELQKQGQTEQVQKAIQELPDKIDHEQHAALLTKFGIDPGKLAASAIEHGIGTPTDAAAASAPPTPART
jgi:hypothetical protein